MLCLLKILLHFQIPMTDFHQRARHRRLQRRIPSGTCTRFPCPSPKSRPLRSHKRRIFTCQL